MTEISFDRTNEEDAHIQAIVGRAFGMGLVKKREMLSLEMDLVACNANGTPIDFVKLRGFDDFNFVHDVGGIIRHMDRETGKLTHCFMPRCARPESEAA